MRAEKCCEPTCGEVAEWCATPTKSPYMESYSCDAHLLVAVSLPVGLPRQAVTVEPYTPETK